MAEMGDKNSDINRSNLIGMKHPLLLLVLFPSWLPAQNPARSMAIANIRSVQTDEWSALQNEAGLGFLTHSSVGISAGNYYGISGLSQITILYNKKLKTMASGIDLSYEGNYWFNRQQSGISAGLKLSPQFSAGARLAASRFKSAENMRQGLVLSGSFGLLYRNSRVCLGIHFRGINSHNYPHSSESPPVNAAAGGRYELAKNLLVFLEIEKNEGVMLLAKSALQFTVNKHFTLSYGVLSAPFTNSFGISFSTAGCSGDLATSHHYALGFSQACSGSLKFPSP